MKMGSRIVAFPDESIPILPRIFEVSDIIPPVRNCLNKNCIVIGGEDQPVDSIPGLGYLDGMRNPL
ncbi:MAG: hypothetical protein Kow009_09030 [Spirochaetales bacterium]